MTEEDYIDEAKATRETIIKKVSLLDGMLSGEHGVGSLRKGFLNQFIPKQEINLMLDIKKVFDPHNLMNPGKIF